MARSKSGGKVYLGVDVGGTKILAVLARPSGKVLGRKRCATPRTADPEDTLKALVDVTRELLEENQVAPEQLRGMGVAVPGVCDAAEGRVIVTPNMNLTGFPMVARLRKTYRVPIALGNDVNLGTLGEQWLGAAAMADSAVGIFVGTGIGGGIIIEGKLVTGHAGAAAEIGHVRMEKDGPLCGCGNRGCFEALASRTAIERDIRQAVAAGRTTVLTRMVGDDLSIIRSSVLKKALEEQDQLVTEVVSQAARTMGEACRQIRHMLDPEVIILGGGVVEACKYFIVPLVQQTLRDDPFSGKRPGGRIVVSTLGDDAVALGAVALAQQQRGRDPFAKARKSAQQYPLLLANQPGSVAADGTTYTEDIYVRVDGKISRRSKLHADGTGRPLDQIAAEELKGVCKDQPSILVIGTGFRGAATLTDDGEHFLRKRGITYEMLPSTEAAETYNAIKGRKAALIHVQ